MNNVSLIGRLVRDPEVKFTPTAKAVANFTIAVDKGLSREKKSEFEAKGMATADFIPIVVWGKQAEHCQTYLAKGRMVAVTGSIQTRSYQAQDGSTRYVTEVLAMNVEFIDWGDKKRSDGYQQSQQQRPGASSGTMSSGTGSGSGLNDYDFDSEFVTVGDDDDVPF